MLNKLKNVFYYSLFMALLWGIFFLIFSFSHSTTNFSSILFAILYSFGHSAEYGLAFFMLTILLVFAITIPERVISVISVLMASIVTLFFIIDFLIYNQFRFHLNMSIISMFLAPHSSDIFIFPKVMYLKFSLTVIFVIVFCYLVYVYSSKMSIKVKKYMTKICIPILVISIISYHFIHAWASFAEYNPITRVIESLPVTYPLTANKMLAEMGFKAPERISRFNPHIMKYPLSEIICEEDKNQYNLIIIAIDSWRFDMLTEDISPNIYRLSKKSLLFDEHYSNANHTRHGIFSLFYGLPGGYWDAALADTVSPVMMDVILDKNYDTIIYGSAALSSPEFHKTVFSKVKNLTTRVDGSDAAKRDIVIANNLLNYLDQKANNEPFFSFLFFDAPHAYQFDEEVYPPKFKPYGVKDYSRLLNKSDVEPLFNQFKNAVGFDDLLVGKIIDKLKEKNLLNNTIIAITGDHGEEFNELGKGYWGHNGNYSKYQTKVPLVLFWPGKEPAIFNYKTSHVDLVPTIMQDLFLCKNPIEDYTTGYNLFNPVKREFIYMQGDEYAIMTDDLITIFRKLGNLETVKHNYDFTEERVPHHVLKSVFEELSRFKKK